MVCKHRRIGLHQICRSPTAATSPGIELLQLYTAMHCKRAFCPSASRQPNGPPMPPLAAGLLQKSIWRYQRYIFHMQRTKNRSHVCSPHHTSSFEAELPSADVTDSTRSDRVAREHEQGLLRTKQVQAFRRQRRIGALACAALGRKNSAPFDHGACQYTLAEDAYTCQADGGFSRLFNDLSVSVLKVLTGFRCVVQLSVRLALSPWRTRRNLAKKTRLLQHSITLQYMT